MELEADIAEKKYVLVEDDLAKTIIQKILAAEGLEGLLQVELCPGGASNIKKYTLLTYSKTGIDNRYIIFDGDQKKDNVPDFLKIPEADKTIDFLKSVFKKVTGIGADKVDWGFDANRKAGRYDVEPQKNMILSYLEFFRNNVFFLPRMIPEDIIYNENLLKSILGEEGFPNVEGEKDAKAKLKKLADSMGQGIEQIEYQLLYWFIKKKNTDYQTIVCMLKEIIEGQDVMEIIKLPSAIVKDRKEIRRKNKKRNRNAYNTLKRMMVPSELPLAKFRKYYHSVLTTEEKQRLIDMGIDPWSVEGLKYAGDCRRKMIKWGDKIEKDN